ncbi:amidohydrolase [Anaerolineales bacterium HSG24]|nr:amidohydrolase [Anaerolineales bacterium HSG24]
MLEQAKQLTPELIRIRRDLHRHPELSFQEFRTAQRIAETLQEIGGLTIKTGVGKTGVMADLGSGDGPTVAIRADMDALPILEKTGAEYASTNLGVMHACGHDGHTAMLLGAAQLLKARFAEENLPGRVRFLFQPAEENADVEDRSGAPLMMAEGALDGVDMALALHIRSTVPTGQVMIADGYFCAAVDTFNAWLEAAGGHGAHPHETNDPIWMIAPVLTALHSIVSRRIDPLHPAVVTIGQVHAGTASNIIPAEVHLQGTLRSFDSEVRQQLIDEVERALSIVEPLGGTYRLKVTRGYPAGPNHAEVRQWLHQVASDFLGAEAISNGGLGLGGEDFAYMTRAVPGAMFILGAAVPDDVQREHHSNIFDIDENALPIGAAILAETAWRFLNGTFAFR